MIAITGGGTGGHLAVAKAVKEQLAKIGESVIFVGSSYGQDKLWFENDKDFSQKYFLDSVGVVNKKGFSKILSLLRVVKNTIECIKILHRHECKAVFSVGGYSAAPLVFAAVVTGTPLFIHEQNAVMGTLNRIARPFAKELFCSFLEESKCRSYPVREEFFAHARVRNEVRNIIFLGGSQGSKAINDFALKCAPALIAKGISIQHQAGSKDISRVRTEYEKLGVDVDVFDFDANIVQRLAAADMAVARAGAGTLFELAANGLPALFIPYPYAAGNHQYHNADYLASRKLAWLSEETSLDDDLLYGIIEKNLQETSLQLTHICDKNGSECISTYILQNTTQK